MLGTTVPIIVEFYLYDNLFFAISGTSTVELIFLYNIINNFAWSIFWSSKASPIEKPNQDL